MNDGAWRFISTEDLWRQSPDGAWACATYKDEEFGVTIGTRLDEVSTFAVFLPESQFAEAKQAMSPHFTAVFDAAAARLPGIKAAMARLEARR